MKINISINLPETLLLPQSPFTNQIIHDLARIRSYISLPMPLYI